MNGTRPSDPPLEHELKCANLVATSTVGCRVDLTKVHRALPDTEYDPEVYFALIFRPSAVRMSCLLNTSGKVVLTGAKSWADCVAGLEALAYTLRSIGYDAVQTEPTVQNMVFTGNFRTRFDLPGIASLGARQVVLEYEPEQFPGLIIRCLEFGRAAILLFSSGAFTVVGCKTVDQLRGIHLNVTGWLESIGALGQSDKLLGKNETLSGDV